MGPGTNPTSLFGPPSDYNFSFSRRSSHDGQFAPRFGLAYRLKKFDLVLRSGAGLFYQTDAGSAVNSNNFNPLSTWIYAPGVVAPSSPLVPAYNRGLSLPRVLEWRAAVEKSLPSGSLLSASYVASQGQELLRREASLGFNQILQFVDFTNHASSNYQAFLGQFRSNLTPSLFALVSYSWAHSIDNASNNNSVFLLYPGYRSSLDRGSSSFDVRHTVAASFNYRVPSLAAPSFARALLAHWNLSSTVQARSGFPFDVTTVDRTVGLGFENTGRPDLVPNQPLWLAHPGEPGGRMLNPAAFSPAANGIGNLGRNILSGPGLFQLDTSLTRRFTFWGDRSLEAGVPAFNLLNHPVFSNPVSYLPSPLFGLPNSTANLMLGSGSPTTGATPLFQAGGPRTVELTLKFSF